MEGGQREAQRERAWERRREAKEECEGACATERRERGLMSRLRSRRCGGGERRRGREAPRHAAPLAAGRTRRNSQSPRRQSAACARRGGRGEDPTRPRRATRRFARARPSRAASASWRRERARQRGARGVLRRVQPPGESRARRATCGAPAPCWRRRARPAGGRVR